MKNLKTIIIAGVIIVVFIIASIIVINLPEASTDAPESAESSETSSETIYVVNEDASSLAGFEIVPTERNVDENTSYYYASEGMKVDITVTVEDGSTTYEYDAEPDPGKFEYDASMFRSMMYTLTSISAKSLVEENAKDLSIYGLDQPTAVIKTYYTDGREIDIILGSMAPVDNDYYCMTSESSNVYTIGSYVDSLLVRKPIEYRDIELFPTYSEDEIYTNINWVCLTDRDGTVVEVLLDSELDNEYNTESSQYVMLQPYQVSGNTSTIQSDIMDVVATLALGSIVKDIDESEYAEYGLDKPAKLEMTDISGHSVSLLIGNICPNSDYTYCMLDGTNTLLTCTSSATAWMGLNYVQYMLRTVWTYNIENLQSIDITVGEDHYDLQVDHYIKQNANGNDVDGVTGTLNGVDIIETNVRRLFIKCLYFRIVDNLTDEEKAACESADAYATITLNLERESHTLELVPVTDRKYGMVVDGVAEYYCNKKSLTNLVNALGYVLDGDELDFSFE